MLQTNSGLCFKLENFHYRLREGTSQTGQSKVKYRKLGLKQFIIDAGKLFSTLKTRHIIWALFLSLAVIFPASYVTIINFLKTFFIIIKSLINNL